MILLGFYFSRGHRLPNNYEEKKNNKMKILFLSIPSTFLATKGIYFRAEKNEHNFLFSQMLKSEVLNYIKPRIN